MEKFKHLMGRAQRVPVVAAIAIVALVATAGPADAAATYDITPVTTGITSELTANVPVILAGLGALMALGIVLRLVFRWFRA